MEDVSAFIAEVKVMSMEALRAKCAEAHSNTTGSRQVLMCRVLCKAYHISHIIRDTERLFNDRNGPYSTRALLLSLDMFELSMAMFDISTIYNGSSWRQIYMDGLKHPADIDDESFQRAQEWVQEMDEILEMCQDL